MSEAQKGKLALYWAASCGGCEIAVLGIDDKILKVAEAFDIVLWPCAADGKTQDIEKLGDDVGHALLGAHVEDGEDVRVVQPARGLGLELEAAPRPDVGGMADLHGHRPLDHRVVGLEDLRRAPPGQRYGGSVVHGERGDSLLISALARAS